MWLEGSCAMVAILILLLVAMLIGLKLLICIAVVAFIVSCFTQK